MKPWPFLAALIGAMILPSMTLALAGDLRAFGRGSWQEIRKAHAGEPLVVHFWGVTCGPCRGEMPQWGHFLADRPKLRVIMIDADLVPNSPASVKAMLGESGLASRTENWVFNDDFIERLRYEIDPRWQGEIPRTLLITADGTTTTLEGVADFVKIDTWLDAQSRGRDTR